MPCSTCTAYWSTRPGGCVAVDDSMQGIASTKLLGMKTVALTGEFVSRELLAGADYVIDALTAIPGVIPYEAGL